MEINRLLTPYNRTVTDGREIKYIVIHYVGALGGAEANCRYFAGKYLGASAHYYVGHAGEIWQSVEEKDIAWHCGADSYRHPECRNSKSLGIEMCVRKKNTKTLEPADRDWYLEPATVAATAELVRELMQKYGIPPENVLRHYDVTGKCCPNPYVMEESLWKEFKTMLQGSGTAEAPQENGKPADGEGQTAIMGMAQATAGQMASYLSAKNPQAAAWAGEHASLYIAYGLKEGVRGDIAFAQRCLETGNDTYKGSAVTPDQHNYGGFGVTARGQKGESFPDAETGILAHIQHLKAYASTKPTKEACVDPRFKYVRRGCSPWVEWLGQQENPANAGKPKKEWVGWAAGKNYGEKILSILSRIMQTPEELPEEKLQEPDLKPEKELEAVRPEPEEELPNTPEIFLITTKTDCLFIRTGPGMDYKKVGAIEEPADRKKRYTIVEQKNGWGRLKSGAGWINLWHTRRAE